MRHMAGALARNVRMPLGLPGAVRAIIASGDYTPMVGTLCARIASSIGV